METEEEFHIEPVHAAEAANTVFWVLLDGAWLHESLRWSIVFTVASLLTCAAIYATIRRDAVGFLSASVITGWVLCNVFWIMGDFKVIASGETIAKVIFYATLLLIALGIALIVRRVKGSGRLIDGLRRVRFARN